MSNILPLSTKPGIEKILGLHGLNPTMDLKKAIRESFIARADIIFFLMKNHGLNPTELQMVLGMKKKDIVISYNNSVVTHNNQTKREEQKLCKVNLDGTKRKQLGRKPGSGSKKLEKEKKAILAIDLNDTKPKVEILYRINLDDKLKVKKKKDENPLDTAYKEVNNILTPENSFINLLKIEEQILINKINLINGLIKYYE